MNHINMNIYIYIYIYDSYMCEYILQYMKDDFKTELIFFAILGLKSGSLASDEIRSLNSGMNSVFIQSLSRTWLGG